MYQQYIWVKEKYMDLKEKICKIKKFRNQTNTIQFNLGVKILIFIMKTNIKNRYSNELGGKGILNGQQWSIIIDIKRFFSHLNKWNLLCKEFEGDLKITKVKMGKFKCCFGIRFYRMSIDPTNEIIEDILNYLFL